MEHLSVLTFMRRANQYGWEKRSPLLIHVFIMIGTSIVDLWLWERRITSYSMLIRVDSYSNSN